MKKEHIFIASLCVFAALRIFFFSGIFPFFNNVDEQAHFDLVYKYSFGDVPTSASEKYDTEVIEYLVLYGSPEYLTRVEEFPGGKVPRPLWLEEKYSQTRRFQGGINFWKGEHNHETASFPVYYFIAGLWCALGRMLGQSGGKLLYWIRFLNIPFFSALVGLSFLFVRSFFRDNKFLLYGVPLLIAFFPQDVFYSINSDCISAFFFGLSLYMLLKIHFEKRSFFYYSLTGILISFTALIKLSNILVFVLLGFILILKLSHIKEKKEVHKILILVFLSIFPFSLWIFRNITVFGDLTGSLEKVKYLGWTLKPLNLLFTHPIFTLKGMGYFISELIRTFWRGEFVWFLKRISSHWVDNFYVITTVVFFAFSLSKVFSRRDNEKFVFLRAYYLTGASVLMMAVLSMLYNFGNSWYPSREQPYFTSGRLISGVLLPFVFIYLDGLENICAKLSKKINPMIVLYLIIAIISVSELILSYKVFDSSYNWFHLQ